MLVNEAKIDPRVKRTRQLVREALVELVQEKPLDNITVQDIAARAGVNRATFYAHFEDKYALMNYTLREMFQEQLAEKLIDPPGFTLANVRCLILTTCGFMGDFIGHCAPVKSSGEQASMFMQIQIHVHETLAAWLEQSASAARRSGESELAAMTLSWAIWGSVFQWARAGRKIPATRLIDQILALLLPGLQAYLVVGV